MKFVKTVEDTKLWKDYLEDSIKGKGNLEGSYYVVNQTGRGSSENTGMIPAVATDIVLANASLRGKKRRKNKTSSRTYKSSSRGRKRQSARKVGRGRKSNKIRVKRRTKKGKTRTKSRRSRR